MLTRSFAVDKSKWVVVGEQRHLIWVKIGWGFPATNDRKQRMAHANSARRLKCRENNDGCSIVYRGFFRRFVARLLVQQPQTWDDDGLETGCYACWAAVLPTVVSIGLRIFLKTLHNRAMSSVQSAMKMSTNRKCGSTHWYVSTKINSTATKHHPHPSVPLQCASLARSHRTTGRSSTRTE